MLKNLESIATRGLTVFETPIVYTVTVMFIGLYASVIAPRLGPGAKKIFDSTIFKVLFFFVVILLAHIEPRVALILAMAFVFSIQTLSKYNILGYWSLFQKKPLPAQPDPKEVPIVDITKEAELEGPGKLESQTYDEVQADDGTSYFLTDDTEVGFPMHPDFVHAGPQALGDPIRGYDESSHLNPSPF